MAFNNQIENNKLNLSFQIEFHEFFKCKHNITIFRNQMYMDKQLTLTKKNIQKFSIEANEYHTFNLDSNGGKD